jgi:hypothetical protein
MKKVSLLVGLMLVLAMLSGCAEFDRSTYRSDQYSGGGHSHH